MKTKTKSTQIENQCGTCQNCCKEALVRATKADIKRWKQQQRYDIILCLESWIGSDAYLIQKELGGCIFLTNKGCEIYETRPDVCRKFPLSKSQLERFRCKLDWKTHKVIRQ